MIPDLLPWQHEAWRNVTEPFQRIPHATLLLGAKGIGKLQFASRFAAALLCNSSKQRPCGTCQNCTLYQAATHPDLHVITSESQHAEMDPIMSAYAERYLEDGAARSKRKTVRTTIVISQSRSLIEESNATAHISNNKVFVVAPVDAMTISAANSVLKVLEEPAPKTYMILIAENVQDLLPTISSRCLKITMPVPSHSESIAWLSEEGTIIDDDAESLLSMYPGPLLAHRMAGTEVLGGSAEFLDKSLQMLSDGKSDAAALAEFGISLGEQECLRWLQQMLCDMIRLNFFKNRNVSQIRFNLRELAVRLDVKQLFAVYDHIGKLRDQIKDGSLDKKLAVEDALLAFSRIQTANH